MEIGDKVKLSLYGKSTYDDTRWNPHNRTGIVTKESFGIYTVDWGGYITSIYELKEIEIAGDEINKGTLFKTKMVLCPVKVGHVEVTNNGKVWVSHFDTKEELEEVILTLSKLKEVMS